MVGRQLHTIAAHLEFDEDPVERFRRAPNHRLGNESVEHVPLAWRHSRLVAAAPEKTAPRRHQRVMSGALDVRPCPRPRLWRSSSAAAHDGYAFLPGQRIAWTGGRQRRHLSSPAAPCPVAARRCVTFNPRRRAEIARDVGVARAWSPARSRSACRALRVMRMRTSIPVCAPCGEWLCSARVSMEEGVVADDLPLVVLWHEVPRRPASRNRAPGSLRRVAS
jgi:hypothetical protein